MHQGRIVRMPLGRRGSRARHELADGSAADQLELA
jgi:hypothetical protein